MGNKELKEYDELLLKVLVIPGKKVNFEKAGIFMVQESKMTGNIYAVQSSEYIGDGLWIADKKFELKNEEKNNGK